LVVFCLALLHSLNMRWRLGLILASCAVSLLAPIGVARADDVESAADDPVISALLTTQAEDESDVVAPLWKYRDARLQAEVEKSLRTLKLDRAARSGQLALALVDTTDPDRPRVAAVNGDMMMYAASLPKIAILLAAFEQAEQGRLRLDARTEASLTEMIRHSSNVAATAMIHRVGVENIARVLMSPRYRFYDPDHNGGLWVGKDYGKAGLWQRDPLHSLSHGATPLQVARFYYLLERDELVSPAASRRMKKILGDTAINHKFAKGLREIDPQALLWRKSGTWGTFHSDSALIEHNERSYIAVALSNHAKGGEWLSAMIVAFDQIIEAAPARVASAARR
jgi:beta-lactamase class A